MIEITIYIEDPVRNNQIAFYSARNSDECLSIFAHQKPIDLLQIIVLRIYFKPFKDYVL